MVVRYKLATLLVSTCMLFVIFYLYREVAERTAHRDVMVESPSIDRAPVFGVITTTTTTATTGTHELGAHAARQQQHEDGNNDDVVYAEKSIRRWPNPRRMFYNRVPKCGSTTAYTMMAAMSKRHNFTHHMHITYPGGYYVGAVRDLASWYFKLPAHSLVVHHVHFIDFSQFSPFLEKKEPLPTHINLIRTPLDRLQSWYYFIRFKHKRKMPDARRNMTYDECVTTRDEECVGSANYFKQIPFFCGLAPECRVPGLIALARAKQNVIQHFAVVGFTEDMRAFFGALEVMFPSWFDGATRLYDRQVIHKKHVQLKNPRGSRVLSAGSRAHMMALLGVEYDFYGFVRQRFAATLRAINGTYSTPSTTL